MPQTGPGAQDTDAGGARVSRRTFLGASAGALAAAAHPASAISAVAKPRPLLLPFSADVWAERVDVHGTPSTVSLMDARGAVPTSTSGNEFQAQVALTAGPNDVWLEQPQAVGNHGERTRRQYLARPRAGPTARISLQVNGAVVSLDASGTEPDRYTGAAIASVQWRVRDGAVLGEGVRLDWPGPWPDGEHYVQAIVTDAAGSRDTACAVFIVQGGTPSAVPAASFEAEWISSACVYGVLAPLFGSPPLQAVTGALDRLAALGVDALWLSPIFATTPGDFGYAVTDHFSVREDYGQMADLQALVAAAHSRGLKVLLDLPLNDTSVHHPYFQQAKRNGASRSRYWDFYERDGNGRAVHYFNWRNLPNLEYSQQEVRTMAIEAAAFWIREADVDGFRCDAAWGVQERAPEFWAELNAEVHRIRPDALMIAEGTARSAAWRPGGFNAAYDWTDQLGEWAWQEAFSRNGVWVAALGSALAASTFARPLRFLDNNDTGRRFITRYGPDVTRAAAALLFALPGIPCLYTGDEIGAEYEPYRRVAPLDWSDSGGLEEFYSELIANRRASPAISNGSLEVLEASPADRLLAFTATTPSEALLVVVNFSGAEASGTVSLPGQAGVLDVRVDAWAAVQQRL